MAERHLAKVEVASSNLVARSKSSPGLSEDDSGIFIPYPFSEIRKKAGTRRWRIPSDIHHFLHRAEEFRRRAGNVRRIVKPVRQRKLPIHRLCHESRRNVLPNIRRSANSTLSTSKFLARLKALPRRGRAFVFLSVICHSAQFRRCRK